MSKPRLLDAYTRDSKTITSKSADYAEVGEWSDENPDHEDRLGYFVSVDYTEPGTPMVKATKSSDVRGVTVENPGFVANANRDMYDSNGKLSSRYSYVAFAGFAKVIDNGRCEVNTKCISDDNGTAIPSTNEYGYQVIERLDDNHVLIMVEPQGDMIQKLADNFIGQSYSVEDGVLILG